MAKHINLPFAQSHYPYRWEYADAAARTGAGGFAATDEGKFARQLDNESIWMLTDYTGPTWQGIGGGDAGAVDSVFGRTGAVTATSGDYSASQITNTPAGNIAAVTVQNAINELDSEKQPLDSDLTAIAGLSPSNDDIIQRKTGAWTNRTMAQLASDLGSAGGTTPSGSAGGALDGTYPNPGLAASVAGNGLSESSDVLSVNVDGSSIEINSDALRVKAGGITNAMLADSDLSDIGNLSPTNDDIIQRKAGAWTHRTMAQLYADLKPQIPVELVLACSDETSVLVAATGVLTFRMPYAMTVSAVRASLKTAASSGTFTVDINEGGTTILSTKLTIDATEKTSTTAATPAVISDSALADDAEITIDIDDDASGDAVGLKVVLIGVRA